jgi:hypothetical protein
MRILGGISDVIGLCSLLDTSSISRLSVKDQVWRNFQCWRLHRSPTPLMAERELPRFTAPCWLGFSQWVVLHRQTSRCRWMMGVRQTGCTRGGRRFSLARADVCMLDCWDGVRASRARINALGGCGLVKACCPQGIGMATLVWAILVGCGHSLCLWVQVVVTSQRLWGVGGSVPHGPWPGLPVNGRPLSPTVSVSGAVVLARFHDSGSSWPQLAAVGRSRGDDSENL